MNACHLIPQSQRKCFFNASIAGSVYYYTILQLSIWWICHVTTLFWKIKFPFHAKQFQNKKSIHVLVVLLAVVLPTIPIIVSFRTGGFVISNHPPLVCVSRSSDAAYYTLALPISIIIATGTSLLFLVLVTVIKVILFYGCVERYCILCKFYSIAHCHEGNFQN